jgi:hypothetical protein
MADWVTISSLATAGGTLVLAVATFSSVRSSNRSARVAERSLLVGLRPVLIPSREEDPVERVRFGDEQVVIVPGHGAAIEVGSQAVYLAVALRNGGSGLAVLHGWQVQPRPDRGAADDNQPLLDGFRRQQLDLYIPAGDTGYWQGALRDPGEEIYKSVRQAAHREQPLQLDLLYGDHEGGQRAIARFILSPWPDVEGKRAYAIRYWSVDGDDPR